MAHSDNLPESDYVVTSTDNLPIISDSASSSSSSYYNGGQGAGGFFTEAIPSISQVLPALFQSAKQKATVILGTANDQWALHHTWATQVGTYIASDWNTFGNLFGVSGQTAMGYGILILVIIISVFGVMLGGKGLVMVALCFPLIIWGSIMGAIGIQWLLVPSVAMVMLWARQFWVKPT